MTALPRPALAPLETGGPAPLVLPLREATERLGAAWDRLADEAAEPNVFTDRAMLRAAAGRVEPDDWSVIALPAIGPEVGPASGGARPLDALAVVRRARVLPGVGPVVTDLFASRYGPLGTPLAQPGFDAGRLIDALAVIGPVARLPYQRLDGPFAASLARAAEGREIHLATVDAHHRAALRLADGPDLYGPGLQGKRLKELGRLMRRLDGAGGVRHEVATTPVEVANAFSLFLALEHASWKGRGGTSLAVAPGGTAFAADLVAELARTGRVRVDLLAVAGRPVAALISFFAGVSGFIWKIAHDESHAAASPGVQLIRLVSEDWRAAGRLADVDSLATPGHPMIDRLWAGRFAMGTIILATRPGANGLAARAADLHARRRSLAAAARAALGRLRGG
ncbi:GNAT family N-acetyltransferase [Chthonobacter rhizosphaerae]|uniref:GNAT family N-acetyltransferase n=1 Tax=Chthonobacter rhizosphaerae TaxID=2735553 RepID=UPI0015EF2A95|nr:GNAT family N-acetyltransferase [Chthonobacter rhizosphaerae]